MAADSQSTIFEDYTTHLYKQIKNKIYDNNTWKSFSKRGHYRELLIPATHRTIFQNAIFSRSLKTEQFIKENGNPYVQLDSMSRIKEVCKGELVRCHKNGDLTIVAPVGSLVADYVFGEGNNYINTKHSYVMCLETDDTWITVFMPCGGPDPDTDEVPPWVEAISLEMLSNINVDKLPTIKSNGLSSTIKKGDEFFLCLRDQVEEGDYVIFNGERVRARAVSVDFNSDKRNCIGIGHKYPFKRDHVSQSFKIAKIPFLQGKICKLPKEIVKMCKPFMLKFDSSKSENIGNTVINFQNFCFNSPFPLF